MNIDDAKRILKLVPEARRSIRAHKIAKSTDPIKSFGRDSRGFEIRPGEKVVFNRSGYLAYGVVKEVRKAFVSGKLESGGWSRQINGDCRIEALNTKKISSVKDPRSVMVIHESWSP